MRTLRKTLIALALLLLLLLSAAYLALNSPYVIDRVAKRFAPEYGFDYETITGNPLRGIFLTNLRYRGRPLARRISVRINPYTLLEGKLTVSRLHLIDVDVGVLERMINDFAAPEETPNESERESTGSNFPLAVEVDNIRLSLLPFTRYGISVKKEELSVESIYYDGEAFAVGRLKQVAETSLGMVELEGTYHKRFLDVDILAVEDLDLEGLERLLRSLGAMGGEENNATVAASAESNATTTGAGREEVDIFLPRNIHAKKFWVTLKPYRYDPYVALEWAQLQGKELNIDLEHSRVLDGIVDADLDTDLGRARLRLTVKEGRMVLEQGMVDAVDLQKILKLASGPGGGEKNVSRTGEKKRSGNATVMAGGDEAIPFLPSRMEIRQLRIELRPGTMEGISYSEPTLKLRNLSLDLRRKQVRAETISANLDTPLAHLNVEAGVDDRAIRIRQMDVKDVNLTRLMELGSEGKADGGAAGTTPERTDGGEAGKSEKTKGLTLPFVPSVIVLETGSVRLEPFAMKPILLRQGALSLKGLRFDLRKLLLERGSVGIDLRSNLAEADLLAQIDDNRLSIDGNRSTIRLGKSLFETFGVPLRAEAFSPLRLSGNADEKRAALRISFSARRILSDGNDSFNVDIPSSILSADYDLENGKLKLHEAGELSVPQAPKIRLLFDLERQKSGALHYRGEIDSEALKLGNAKVEKLLGSPRIGLRGDLHTLDATIRAGVFDGSFVSNDLKKGLLVLKTAKAVKLADYVKLPEKLAAAEVKLRVETPVDFAKPLPVTSRLELRSNLADIDGKLRYDGNLSAELLTRFPQNSLLAAFDPRLRLQALNPLKLTLDQNGELWHLILDGKKIKGTVDYSLATEKIMGVLNIAGSRVKVEGEPRKVITATLRSPSVKKTITGITEIYRVEVPKLDGDVALTLRVERLAKASLELRSKQFIPDATARIKSPIKNIDVLLEGNLEKKELILKRYGFETAGMKIYATKPSTIRLQKNRVFLDAFWVNDSLRLTGDYDLKTRRGTVQGKAARFKVDHENARIDAAVDMAAKIEGEKIDLKGKIILLGGTVNYDLQAKHYATDEDIVILQHRKKNEDSFFTKNVQLNLYIETKKPLLFKQKDVYVELRPQLSILKGFGSDLQMMGSIPLAKGGYYIFEGKRFVLQPSSINFTGKPTRPLLDINLVYRRYSKTVYITVTGMATEPSLNFSSDPYMTRDQILSFILFDTTDSGESAGNMLSMVGGGIAKSILANMGLKVDTLILTQQGFEVGKKITDRISILYDQKEENPRVIVRIQNSKSTETDISIGSESQSVDIIYKKEF